MNDQQSLDSFLADCARQGHEYSMRVRETLGPWAQIVESLQPGYKVPRTCIDCRHFYAAMPTRGYSEMTPGSEFSMECEKRVWVFDATESTQEDYRRTLLTAQSCTVFEERKS